MSALANLKKPPAKVRHKERPLQVEAIQAEHVDVPVVMAGHGEVKALDVVSIASELSGR